jgi:hypothetical protein
MRDESTVTPAGDEDGTNRTVMLILLGRSQPWPRSIDEFARELGRDPGSARRAGSSPDDSRLT